MPTQERRRDTLGAPLCYSHAESGRLVAAVQMAGERQDDGPEAPPVVLPWGSCGLAGGLRRVASGEVERAAPLAGLAPLRSAACTCFLYEEPPPRPHRCALLEAAAPVPPRLTLADHAVVSYASQYSLLAEPAAAAARGPPPSQRVSQRGGGGKRKKRTRDDKSGHAAEPAAMVKPAAAVPPPPAPASALSCEGLFGFSF